LCVLQNTLFHLCPLTSVVAGNGDTLIPDIMRTLEKTKNFVKYILYRVQQSLQIFGLQGFLEFRFLAYNSVALRKSKIPIMVSNATKHTLCFLFASYIRIDFYKTIGACINFVFTSSGNKSMLIAVTEKKSARGMTSDFADWVSCQVGFSDLVIVILYRTLFARNFACSVNGSLFFSEVT